jgi:RND superfamily putative drug exporter
MAIVFLGLATSGVTGVKSLGVGLAIAVLIDATLVRVVLVPAIMRLAGRFNWWAPRLAGARR